MSRRSFKTINLPREVVDWIDSVLRQAARDGKPGPLGIRSRDEFVRIAVAFLGVVLQPPLGDEAALEVIQGLLRKFEQQHPSSAQPDAPQPVPV